MAKKAGGVSGKALTKIVQRVEQAEAKIKAAEAEGEAEPELAEAAE